MDDSGPYFCDIGDGLDAGRGDLPCTSTEKAEEENGQTSSEM